MNQLTKRIPWNKGLTKETSDSVKAVAVSKSKWWKENDTESTRKKIGEASKGRPGKKGKDNHFWKGGRYSSKRDGYIYIRKPDCLSANSKGYVLEHRYVMENHLGRMITQDEEVHHINGIKDDNSLENLEVVVKSMHFGNVCCPHCQKEFKVK